MLGKCWRFWDFPMSLWQHPQDFPDFPQANHPSPWDSGHVEAHGWRDPRSPIWWPSCWSSSPEGERSIWVDLGDQLSGYVRCWIFWRSTQLVCCQRGPSCWIVAQLLDFQEFLGLSAAKTKEIKAAGLESWRVAGVAGRKTFEIPKSLWGPYSNRRRKDGTARGVESGSALRGPFRDFGFAWHGFVDLFLLAL